MSDGLYFFFFFFIFFLFFFVFFFLFFFFFLLLFFFFFFNDTATTEFYTLSLHDALPILIFLKYISDSFSELFEQLEQDDFSDPEDRDEYLAENVFFLPKDARRSEEHTSELQSRGLISYAVFFLQKKNKHVSPV